MKAILIAAVALLPVVHADPYVINTQVKWGLRTAISATVGCPTAPGVTAVVKALDPTKADGGKAEVIAAVHHYGCTQLKPTVRTIETLIMSRHGWIGVRTTEKHDPYIVLHARYLDGSERGA